MKAFLLLVALQATVSFTQDFSDFLDKFKEVKLAYTSPKTNYKLEFLETDQDFLDAGLMKLTDDEIQAYIDPFSDGMYSQYFAVTRFNLPFNLTGIIVYKNAVNINNGMEQQYYNLVILNSQGEQKGELTLTSWWADDTASGMIYSKLAFDGENLIVSRFKNYNSNNKEEKESTYYYDAYGDFIEQ